MVQHAELQSSFARRLLPRLEAARKSNNTATSLARGSGEGLAVVGGEDDDDSASDNRSTHEAAARNEGGDVKEAAHALQSPKTPNASETRHQTTQTPPRTSANAQQSSTSSSRLPSATSRLFTNLEELLDHDLARQDLRAALQADHQRQDLAASAIAPSGAKGRRDGHAAEAEVKGGLWALASEDDDERSEVAVLAHGRRAGLDGGQGQQGSGEGGSSRWSEPGGDEDSMQSVIGLLEDALFRCACFSHIRERVLVCVRARTLSLSPFFLSPSSPLSLSRARSPSLSPSLSVNRVSEM